MRQKRLRFHRAYNSDIGGLISEFRARRAVIGRRLEGNYESDPRRLSYQVIIESSVAQKPSACIALLGAHT